MQQPSGQGEALRSSSVPYWSPQSKIPSRVSSADASAETSRGNVLERAILAPSFVPQSSTGGSRPPAHAASFQPTSSWSQPAAFAHPGTAFMPADPSSVYDMHMMGAQLPGAGSGAEHVGAVPTGYAQAAGVMGYEVRACVSQPACC